MGLEKTATQAYFLGFHGGNLVIQAYFTAGCRGLPVLGVVLWRPAIIRGMIKKPMVPTATTAT